jgi:ferredoxin-nitrite reductase
MSHNTGFSPEQQSYLQGLALGADVARTVHGLPVLSGSAGKTAQGVGITLGGGADPSPHALDPIHAEAQNTQIAAGGKLCNEENAKRERNPLDMWDQLREAASRSEFPKAMDVFLYKSSGLFFVAPAQNAFMCRLRIPGGMLKSWQLRGVAELSDSCGGGYADLTTRANFQIRQIPADKGVPLITGLADLGIITRGSGADNIRNITASPTAGIDPQELIDTTDLVRELHHYILNNSFMYGLPRKFNIAFDGGGKVASLQDTNDIGFSAVRVPEESATADSPAGVYFRLELGGITGHKDFARDTQVMLHPDECIPAAAAIVRVFIEHGDRTDRKKARLKYLLDDWGFDKFLEHVQKHLPFELRRFPLDDCEPRGPIDKHAHIGVHGQRQEGLSHVGVILPVGRMTADQMRGVADIAEKFGDGIIRLTVWQNLLISGIPNSQIDAVAQAIDELGLRTDASNLRGSLVACTGSAGCKYAAADTKRHALALVDYLEDRIDLDSPINIHLTGCHHSCAQHYIGDIGLLGAKVDPPGADPDGDHEMVEGYHVFIGGGHGEERGIGREFKRSVAFEELPGLIEGLLRAYQDKRESPAESFVCFTRRHEIDALHTMVEASGALELSTQETAS